MQLGSKEDESERFTHYLSKTFKKTASLLANGCKSVRTGAARRGGSRAMGQGGGGVGGVGGGLLANGCKSAPTAALLPLMLAVFLFSYFFLVFFVSCSSSPVIVLSQYDFVLPLYRCTCYMK